MAICGTVVDHKLLSAEEIHQRYEQVGGGRAEKFGTNPKFQSVSAWNEFCPEEPYDFLQSIGRAHEPYQQKSKYDMAGAVQRQRNFNYQVGEGPKSRARTRSGTGEKGPKIHR